MKKQVTVEKKVILTSDKKHVAVICDPALTVKDIMDRMSMNPPQILMVMYSEQAGEDDQRFWRLPSGVKAGHKVHSWTRAEKKHVGTTGLANLLYNQFPAWKDNACGLKSTMAESKPGTLKEVSDVVGMFAPKKEKKIKSDKVVTLTITVTPEMGIKIMQLIQGK
jgi:hypothetical protein